MAKLASVGALNLFKISTTLSKPIGAFIFFPPNQLCKSQDEHLTDNTLCPSFLIPSCKPQIQDPCVQLY